MDISKENKLSIEANKKAKEIIKTLENKELWFRPSELKQMLKIIVNRL